jgi:hypothetical protein
MNRASSFLAPVLVWVHEFVIWQTSREDIRCAFAIAYALFEIPSGYLVRAPLIRQWDNRAQPGVIEPLLERGEEDGEPELARAM